MLAASGSAPNSPMPTPSNWRGVAAGLSAAKQAYHAGHLDSAEEVLREVLEFAPAEAKAWGWLGKVLQLKGDAAQAAHCLEKAKQLLARRRSATAKPPASVQLAKLLWQQGERRNACAMVKDLLAERPEDTSLRQLIEQWSQETTV